jgi:hypothetical protein
MDYHDLSGLSLIYLEYIVDSERIAQILLSLAIVAILIWYHGLFASSMLQPAPQSPATSQVPNVSGIPSYAFDYGMASVSSPGAKVLMAYLSTTSLARCQREILPVRYVCTSN